MEEKRDHNISDKAADEVILPGFRFHPTDEELVGFYLKRKIQQKPLTIELIRQLDIYRYDPWDLPKLATTGEKEWYFYCPRDRKYRNSARPNRVTGAGFWKATGTDRPIYSSEGTNKCIGLKKSLVFYKGRAAKGVKTDWMMHEFRLPSLTDSSIFRKPLDKNFSANECWAICRIFKKTSSVVHRALSQSWISQATETNEADMFTNSQTTGNNNQHSSNLASCTTEAASLVQFSYNNNNMQPLHQQVNCYPSLDLSYPISCNKSALIFPSSNAEVSNTNCIFAPIEMQIPTSKCNMDITSMLFNISPTVLTGDFPKASASIDFSQLLQQQANDFTGGLSVTAIDARLENGTETTMTTKRIRDYSRNSLNNNEPGDGKVVSNGPLNVPHIFSDEWKGNMPWDSPPYDSSEMSASYSTNTSLI